MLFCSALLTPEPYEFDNRNVEPIPVMQMVTHVVEFCRDNHYNISITKINKLLYFVYGVILAKFGKRLFIDDMFHCGTYGPHLIIPTAALKHVGIKKFQNKSCKDYNKLPNDYKIVVDQTISQYAKYSDSELIELTTTPTGPWRQAKKDRRFYIDDRRIQQYFIN